MKTYAVRLHRGDDLRQMIETFVKQHNIQAGCILSAVGSVQRIRLRDASGKNIQQIDQHAEIVSVTGTVGCNRCHIHIAFSLQDLSVVGGHLTEGCIINTTCELVIAQLDHMIFSAAFDDQTGYNELSIQVTE